MSTFDSLDKTFEVEAEIIPAPIKKPKIEKPRGEDKDADYKYQRAQLYDIVETMSEAVQGALEVAQQSDHPRAYEVVLNGAKAASEVVDKLGDLHKKMKDIETLEEVRVQQHGSTTNNVFMSGSTADLMKMLKETKA